MTPELPRFDGAPIVPTRLRLAVYVRERAGKLEVVVDDKCWDMCQLHDARVAAVKAIEARFNVRYDAWLANGEASERLTAKAAS